MDKTRTAATVVAAIALLAGSALSSLALVSSPRAEAQTAKPMYGAWGFDLTAMDRSVAPGSDFNHYASGAWLARTTIPADKPIASLRYLMSDLTESPPARPPRDCGEQGRRRSDQHRRQGRRLL